MVVDFDSVRKNAAEQGIDLSKIAILYEGLTASEILSLEEAGCVAYKAEKCVIGKFTKEGREMFGTKAVGVYYPGDSWAN